MNKRNLGLLVLVVLVLASGVLLYNQQIKGMSSPPVEENLNSEQDQAKGEKVYGVEIGNYAPEFELEDLEGEDIRLSDYKGKYVMLNFWASWCPPCRAEMPDLDQFHKENKDNFVVLGVNVGESREVVKEFMNKGGYTYPTLLDQSRSLSYVYRASVIPTSYFINPEGRIVYIKRGLVTKAELDEVKRNITEK